MVKKDLGLCFLRGSVGLIMLIAHGWPKLLNYEQLVSKFPDPLGIGHQFSLIAAISTEFFGSILIIIGLWTRWAAGSLLITMLVAAFVFHINDPWNKKELGVMYAIIYLAIIFTGPGAFAVDKRP
jgi:putative oxidoreductase